MTAEIYFTRKDSHSVVQTEYIPMLREIIEFDGNNYQVMSEKTIMKPNGDVTHRYTAIINLPILHV